MARIIVFDVRFKNDQGVGQTVDTDLYADFYEDGNATAKERRTRGTNRDTHILQTADGEGVYYSTRVDITGYVAGDVTVRWYANRSGQSVLPSPFEETLPYPLETTLTGGFLTDYVKTMLGFPATSVELVGNHYTVVIDDTLAVYNQYLPRERFGTIGLVVGQNAYPLPNIPTRGPTHLHFIRKEGTPLISDPLFGREYPRGQQLDFDQYVLGISFWETLNRVTCYTGNTKVRLLDGRTRTMKELAKEYPSKKDTFWVYSYSRKKKRIVPGLARNARKVNDHAPVYRVTLDNDEHIDCTPNNRFLTRSGKFKRVDRLKKGDSIMPFYSKREHPSSAWAYDYEMVHAGKGKYTPTHQLVAKDLVPYLEDKHCLHHKDFDRFNNCPENLEWLTWPEHMKAHGDNWDKTLGKWIAEGGHKTPEYSKAISEALKESYAEGRSVSAFRKLNGDPSFQRKRKKALNSSEKALKARREVAYINSQNENRKKVCSDRMKRMMADPDFVRKSTEARRKVGWGKASERMKRVNHENWHLRRGKPSPDCELCIKEGLVDQRNHKVKSVKFLGYKPVYDIEVDKYGVFALDAGVFGHNSQEPEWIWSAANQTIYINIGGTNIAGDPGSYYVMYRYYEPVGLDGVIGTHFNWFRRFCLAKSKQVLSRIRGKFSGEVPAPGGRIKLDSSDLAREGREEEERLLTEIRNLVPTVPPIHG